MISPVSLGPVADLDPLRLAVGRGRRPGWSPGRGRRSGRSSLRVFCWSRIVDLLAGEAPRQQLGLEPDEVVDEDDVIDEQVGQLQVAGRLGVPRPTCRAAPPSARRTRPPWPAARRRSSGRRSGAGSPRAATPAQLGEDLADAVAQPGLAAVGLDLSELLERPARRPRACRSRPAAGPRSRRGRASPCAASAARGAPWRRPRRSQPLATASRLGSARRPAPLPAFALRATVSSASGLGLGVGVLVGDLPLAESSTMTTK